MMKHDGQLCKMSKVRKGDGKRMKYDERCWNIMVSEKMENDGNQ